MNRSKNSNRIISSSDDESCSDSDCVETDGNPVANSIASCSRPRRRKKKIQRLGTVSETYDDLVNTLERQKSYENDNSNDHSVSEPILKRLFDDMQAKIITKFEESFRVIEKKVDDAIVQITRVEFKIGARRSVSESMTVRKRSRLLSITRETPLSDIKSLGFPLKSTADVEKFENDLKQEEYRQNVLEALMNINGNGGEMNAGKLIRLTFKEMFTEATLGCYTYTGKNKNTKRFDVFANIREIVYDLLKAADRTYTLVEYERDLVEKIFKYAYKGRYDFDPDTSYIYFSLISFKTLKSTEKKVLPHLPRQPAYVHILIVAVMHRELF